MTDVEFWAIVHNDAAFRARFHGRAHPLQESNGGVDFHNSENLRAMLVKALHDVESMPKAGMSAWARKKRVSVLQSWYLQVCWVFDHGQFLNRGVANDGAGPHER